VSTDDETLARFAVELSRVPVDVIFAGNAPSTRAAMQATRVIPIITVSADPVSTGFVATLAQPGGNVTGVAIMHTELSGKRLEILTQALPAARRIAFLVNPANPSTPAVRRETEARARALGVKLLPFEVSAPERVAKVMAAVAKEHPDALVVQGGPLFQVTRQEVQVAATVLGLELHVVEVRSPGELDRAFAAATRTRAGAAFIFGRTLYPYNARIAELAVKRRLATVGLLPEFARDGWLIGYGTSLTDQNRRAADFVDRIPKGAKPAELPVEQPTTFYLAINLKTARALGLSIPPSLLQRADQVIE